MSYLIIAAAAYKILSPSSLEFIFLLLYHSFKARMCVSRRKNDNKSCALFSNNYVGEYFDVALY